MSGSGRSPRLADTEVSYGHFSHHPARPRPRPRPPARLDAGGGTLLVRSNGSVKKFACKFIEDNPSTAAAAKQFVDIYNQCLYCALTKTALPSLTQDEEYAYTTAAFASEVPMGQPRQPEQQQQQQQQPHQQQQQASGQDACPSRFEQMMERMLERLAEQQQRAMLRAVESLCDRVRFMQPPRPAPQWQQQQPYQLPQGIMGGPVFY